MDTVTSRTRNPFDLDPPCDPFVPGYGDSNADFHIIGDHPGRHGGTGTGIPFTASRSGRALQEALGEVGLVVDPGDRPLLRNCYLSYLYLCAGKTDPTAQEYRDMELFFDAELRAITAHVLVPVGERPARFVMENYSQTHTNDFDLKAVHATEISNGAWIVIPSLDPTDWNEEQRDAIVSRLQTVMSRDYRRESDLGRFFPGGDPYLVR